MSSCFILRPSVGCLVPSFRLSGFFRLCALRQPFGAGPVLPAWPPSRPRPPFSKRPRDPTSRVPAVCREHPEREPISVPLAKRAGLHRGALYGLSAVKHHRRQRRFVDSAAFVGLERMATHYTADGLVLIAPVVSPSPHLPWQRLGCADWPARGFCWHPRCVAAWEDIRVS